ncbi:MAG TPA: hypothetical protein DDX33_06425 [Rikenellaceae bacterium]|nr:hypothetical protein [Rikenellaceae bacterium]
MIVAYKNSAPRLSKAFSKAQWGGGRIEQIARNGLIINMLFYTCNTQIVLYFILNFFIFAARKLNLEDE